MAGSVPLFFHFPSQGVAAMDIETSFTLHPAAVRSLAAWHDMVERKDLRELASIVHPDAVFRSPMAFKPYESAQALILVLKTVVTIFEDFTYHRRFVGHDGLGVVLEFSAAVDGRKLKGIDMIRFDEGGLIVDFEVMIRPFSGLQALGARMGERLGHLLPDYKAKP